MRYWVDTEFIENGSTIDLISIGIVADDGREYYAINRDCDFSKASDWVEENVLNPIGLSRDIGANINPQNASPNTLESYLCMRKKEFITLNVLEFMGGESIVTDHPESERIVSQLKPGHSKPEIWGYYADYDWVVFAQLFGTMMDLPTGFPMYCRDIKQECDRLGNPELPAQASGEHNALADARHNKKMWEFLQTYSTEVP
jgi:3' exoribonuclease, RNase T-like